MLSENFWQGTKQDKDAAQINAEIVFLAFVGCEDEE